MRTGCQEHTVDMLILVSLKLTNIKHIYQIECFILEKVS